MVPAKVAHTDLVYSGHACLGINIKVLKDHSLTLGVFTENKDSGKISNTDVSHSDCAQSLPSTEYKYATAATAQSVYQASARQSKKARITSKNTELSRIYS